jgi:hypothetical protein
MDKMKIIYVSTESQDIMAGKETGYLDKQGPYFSS